MFSRPVLRIAILMLLLAPAALLFLGCPNNPPDELVSSRSYSGHESDLDANNFVRAYPAAMGTRLDDCQLCHRAGQAGTSTSKVYNACSYCHIYAFNDTSYTIGVPGSYYDTLNPFGQDYHDAGESQEAFALIAAEDSDGDTFSNEEEIAENRFPGNANSKPGNPLAATIELTQAQVAAMGQHSQFLLMNASKQQYDDYTTYTGPKVKDFLVAAGVDLTEATGITVFAPDGFSKDFTMDNINNQYPDGLYRAVVQLTMDPTLRFVTYPNPIPTDPSTGFPYADGAELGDLWLTIALQRDGAALSTSYYDSVTGRLEGEGPFRIIPPQGPIADPADRRPDRGSQQPQANPDDGYNNLDLGPTVRNHNAGDSVRGMCIIRINPMPADREEYDTSNGWTLIGEKKIVIYGLNID